MGEDGLIYSESIFQKIFPPQHIVGSTNQNGKLIFLLFLPENNVQFCNENLTLFNTIHTNYNETCQCNEPHDASAIKDIKYLTLP